MREIRFRAWDKKRNEMVYFDFQLLHDESSSFYNEQIKDNPLMQFTGLKDKYGREIYEGDIIQGNLFDRRLPTMGTVVYDREYACFGNENEAGITFLFKIADIEVIGNIWENQKLLNGGSEGRQEKATNQ